MKYDFSNDAIKAIGKMDANTAGRIIKGIIGLPGKGDTKPMEGYPDDSMRLRVGGYRVIYRLIEDGRTIHIQDIGSRGDIYK
ncbi:MAG: type II toxin-antitoxin system RelE/ParE family toxin [Defluviitaleaceae bacterium]|nr:type II toxin-antitoxin system RelE/ParE family toxin [Defluviitaleaceae bacterium]